MRPLPQTLVRDAVELREETAEDLEDIDDEIFEELCDEILELENALLREEGTEATDPLEMSEAPLEEVLCMEAVEPPDRDELTPVILHCAEHVRSFPTLYRQSY